MDSAVNLRARAAIYMPGATSLSIPMRRERRGVRHPQAIRSPAGRHPIRHTPPQPQYTPSGSPPARREVNARNVSEDGWFPFLELLGGDYRELADLYATPDARRFVDHFIDRFNAERLQAIVQRWWRNPVFQAKEEILLAGIDSFRIGTQRGAIACLKILYSEIEGLIRIACSKENNAANLNFKDLVRYVDEKGRQNFDTNSLAFPDAFYRYVKDHVFASFDLATGDIPLSRHSSSHGVAEAATYTRAKALQAILTLDQLSFYLRDEQATAVDGRPSP